MVRCGACGQLNATDARFCKSCGAALPERAESAVAGELRAAGAAEPAQAASDLPEIPDIAPIASAEDVEPDKPLAEAHDQASRDALAVLANAAEERLEKMRADDPEAEPEVFAHRDYTSERDYSERDYSVRDYGSQDYGRDYAPRDEPQPRPPLLPPIEAAIREEAALQAPATSSSPQDAKEMDGDVKKLGASCGWGCAILFVVWIIAMVVVAFIKSAG